MKACKNSVVQFTSCHFWGWEAGLATISPKCVSSMLKNATQKMAAFGLFRAVLKCNSYDTNLQPPYLVPESPKLLSTRLPLESWRETPRG